MVGANHTNGHGEQPARPAEETILLPDNTPVHIQAEDDGLTITAGAKTKARFQRLERTIPVTPEGMLNEDRLTNLPVLHFRPATEGPDSIAIPDVWAMLYALWIRHPDSEALPVSLDEGFVNAHEIRTYLVHTGLAFQAKQGSSDLVIVRSSFWQAAGAPLDRAWLRAPVPHPSLHSSLAAFPPVTAFTRGPNVLTTHPLRPPKPAPGSVVYQRYICTVRQMLTFTHIDASNPKHFEAYCRWQNSDRVNLGWRERGSEEKHRKYLKDRLEDPHIMGLVVSWDGEPAGYSEWAWMKEDGMATYVGGLGDYDQGTHLLVGEEKFRGRHRFTAVAVSMKHACFLRDLRTDIVVGEPRHDLPIVPLLKTYLPQELNREFELPHKRAVYFVLRRHRFFQAAILD